MELHRSPILFQRGRGLGNVIGRLFRYAIPFISQRRGIIKQGLKTLGKAAGKAALSAASESLQENKPFKESLKQAGRRELEQLVERAKTSMAGQGRALRRRRRHSRHRKPRGIKTHRRTYRVSVSRKRRRASPRRLDVFDYLRRKR